MTNLLLIVIVLLLLGFTIGNMLTLVAWLFCGVLALGVFGMIFLVGGWIGLLIFGLLFLSILYAEAKSPGLGVAIVGCFICPWLILVYISQNNNWGKIKGGFWKVVNWVGKFLKKRRG